MSGNIKSEFRRESLDGILYHYAKEYETTDPNREIVSVEIEAIDPTRNRVVFTIITKDKEAA